jgi:hypothetical protein
MSTNSKSNTVALLVWLGIIIAAIVGWIMNLGAIIDHDFALETGMGILRVIGVFMAPIGAVLGYI